MAGVEETWVKVLGADSSIVSLGIRPGRCVDVLEEARVMLIVPGNPGLAAFYEEFMLSLHARLADPTLTLWALSYIGHQTRTPSLLPRDQTYTLEEQVEHKLALLDLLLPPSARITLIGHSIGCRIIIDILARNTTHTFHNIYFLFPTMENMISTPKGVATLPLTTTWRPLLLALLTVLNLLLPPALLRAALRLWMPSSPEPFIRAAARWRNPNYLNNCLVLARDELETVLELDPSRLHTLGGLAGRLRAYYGATDGWAPLAYRARLLARLPCLGEANLEVCRLGMAHAFVERSGEEMAGVVAGWEAGT